MKFDLIVVGAGLTGMTAAHHLAEWGARVLLIDSAPHIGGAFLLLDHTFTTDSCGLCLALPRQPSYCPTIASDLHPRITIRPQTTLTSLEGEPGHFVATLRRGPRYVDPELCDNCGACAAVCPVTRESAPYAYPRSAKAIYPPPPRAVPFTYALDPEACTRCGACVEACPRGAIDLAAASITESVEIGALVLAPGFAPFDAARALEYGWGRCANVLTSLEFERMLNRSGPTGGAIRRPSDGQPPRRIAFIQCVGSRSEALGRPYCSTSCCMITAKQVGLTQDVAPGSETTVFTMDVRTAGKGYERYFQRVAARPGVTYRRSRPAAVHEIPQSRNLRLLTSAGEEEFDLVVLAVGMGPADGLRELAVSLDVDVDQHGFIRSGDDGPGTTSQPGIFAAGAGLAPTDVPETVTQAEAAAALAVSLIASLPVQNAGGRARADGRARSPAPTVPSTASRADGRALEEAPPRIGLFLCDCRGTLSDVLDFAALKARGERLRAVAHVEQLEAACTDSGLAAIEHAVEAHDLNRVVIAACSPHSYAEQLDGLMARLGLPPRLLARANIREGVAWPHGRDTAAAWGAVQMAVAGLRETPYRPFELQASPPLAGERAVLILGGGLSGMMAALTLSEMGVKCDLVEREPRLGGNLHESRRTLEGLDVQALLADMTDMIERLRRAGHLRVWTEAELVGWEGVRGEFTAQSARGWAARISLADEVFSERYGALIVATGARPATTREYLYGQHPAVLTQRELETQIAAHNLNLNLKSITMIQCVGSRDEERPYCSRLCCGHAIKNALALKELDPDIEINILFRDIRTMGTQELAYREARRRGVRFFRYEPPEKPLVEAAGERLRVTVHDTLYDERVTLMADLLALSTGIAPRDNRPLAEMLGLALDEDGFFAEAHPKLRPTDLSKPGLFLCGLAYGPRSIEESMAQARAAALRAALVVARPAEPRRDVVTVERKLCSFCGLCVEACPYGARALDYEERFARVIEHLCQGCGVCVAVCPNGASRQPAFEPVQALAQVDAALVDWE